MKTLSVPWDFRDSETIKTWQWKTEHFDAEIKTDDHRFLYTVVDKSAGGRKMILNGIGASSKEAEASILDKVGKSYPLELGYRKYAGHYATTFRIYSGDNIDFGPLEGRKVTVEARDRGELNKTYTGLLRVHHYYIMITSNNGKKIKIPPHFVTAVRAEMVSSDSERIGSGRTIKGNPANGCTGIAGFINGTVDHPPSAPFCPIHQV